MPGDKPVLVDKSFPGTVTRPYDSHILFLTGVLTRPTPVTLDMLAKRFLDSRQAGHLSSDLNSHLLS